MSKLSEALSEEEYDEYFPDSWDPCDSENWKSCPNPDDYSSALYSVMELIAFEKWDLNDRECEEIAHAVSNAWFEGHRAGFASGKEKAE